jgi:ankyrin repeat protein
MRFLVRHGASMDALPELELEVRSRWPLQHNCAVARDDFHASAQESPETALMWAAREGVVDAVTELVRLGADLEAREPVVCALLLSACLAIGPPVTWTQHGATALLIADQHYDPAAAAELVRLGADITAQAAVRGGMVSVHRV